MVWEVAISGVPEAQTGNAVWLVGKKTRLEKRRVFLFTQHYYFSINECILYICSMNLKHILLLTGLLLYGCVATGPKYTRVEKVMKLRNGMTQKMVDSIVALKPYDLVSIDKEGNRTMLYKYRVTDRRTLPFLLRDTNGFEYKGKFADLLVTYNHADTVVCLESKGSDSEIKTKKLDINALITLVSITVPSVLVYLGLKSN
ncbi:MAG: hypothetical protein ACHQF2_03325 [Flavobacteriales bacterium]